MAVPGRGVSSLQSSINKGSADDFEHSCGQCLVDELDVEAHGFCVVCHVYLCVTCFRAHSRNQASRQHKLLGKSELSKVKIAQESAKICTEKCPVHGQEIIKFFCPEHETLCCNDCVILNHKHCEIDYIPDKCSEMGQSIEYTETLQELETRQKMINNIKVEAKTIEGDIDSSANIVINEIRTFEQELHDHIRNLRKKLESEVEIRRTTNKQLVKTVVDTCCKMETNMEQLRKGMVDPKHEAYLAHRYISTKRSKNALKSEKVSECRKMLRDTRTRFCFERSVDLDKLSENTVCLGTLKGVRDKPRDAVISRIKVKLQKLCCLILYIGSSHVTFGFSFVSNPKSALRKEWCGQGTVTDKAPADLLIYPDGRSVCAFGYEAGQKYNELVETSDNEKYFYYNGDYILNIYRDMDENKKNAYDVSGKKLSSVAVLSILIRVLKDEAISWIRKQLVLFSEGDTHFVITVPERFETAREALIEAGEKAGVVSEDLTIAFETEAAFMYTQDPDNYFRTHEECLVQLFREGTRYLVLDARDKLFTVTVYEVRNDKSLQLYHVANESCGGYSVTEEAEKFVSSLYGQEIMQHCKTTNPKDYREIMFGIEKDLRSCKTENSRMCINLRMKVSLNEIVKERTGGTVHKLIQKQITQGKIGAIGDKLRIDSSIWKRFFHHSMSTITSRIHSILQDKAGLGCKAIVMIGGFSQSPILQEGLKREFSDLLVVVPKSPELAILLGAVSLGHSL